MADATVAPAREYIESLTGFADALRKAGVPVGSGEMVTFCDAVALLDPSDLVDVFWAGRTSLVARRQHLAVYDRVFREWFLGDAPERSDTQRMVRKLALVRQIDVDIPAAEPPEPGEDEPGKQMGLMASQIEIWRHKSFAACTPEEMAAIRRIMKKVRMVPPMRRSRRTEKAPSGSRPDMRRVARAAMRSQGAPPELLWRRRRRKARPLVLILDVSGSMADYSRALLQFAYSTRQAAAKVEVFCFGTRLTRVTKALERRRVDDALDEAARAVFDWEGGTRIGGAVDAFVKGWGRKGMSRGAVVVICSDGLDRGDPALLARAMEQLSRVSHKIVWLNPHKGADREFVPSTLGMMVAAPHVDLLMSGHDLASLEELAERLPELR